MQHRSSPNVNSFMQSAGKRCKSYCSREKWMDRFPITRWMPEYKLSKMVRDLIAGLTVGLTVIPQGLAYANVAKLPLEYGLYSAFMGGFVYMFLGMSKDITVGPAAIMSLLVAGHGMPLEDGLNDPTYAILLSFFCGVIQVFMGIFHLGFVTNYISHVVISGFTSASAIIIGFGQIRHILGISFSAHSFLEEVIEIAKHITETRWQDLLLGLGSILFLATLKWLKNVSQSKLDGLGKAAGHSKRLPWKGLWIIGTARSAVCVIITGALAYLLTNSCTGEVFTVTGNVTQGLPTIQAPNFAAPDIFAVLQSGLAIVPLIGFLGNIAIARGFARQNNYRVESNQELIALGCCNVAGSFVSAYPVTGSFSRSAINSQCDVATPASGIVAGSLVLLALAFLTPLFYYIPKASLAAVIIYSVLFMVDYKVVLELWKVRKIDLLPLGATFLGSLGLGVEYGTLIGIGVDLILLILPHAKPKTEVSYKEGIIIVEMERGLRYPAVDKIENLLDEECIMRDIPRSVIFDFTYVSAIDYSMLETLKTSASTFTKKGQKFGAVNCRKKITDILKKADIEGLLIFETLEKALVEIDRSNAPAANGSYHAYNGYVETERALDEIARSTAPAANGQYHANNGYVETERALDEIDRSTAPAANGSYHANNGYVETERALDEIDRPTAPANGSYHANNGYLETERALTEIDRSTAPANGSYHVSNGYLETEDICTKSERASSEVDQRNAC